VQPVQPAFDKAELTAFLQSAYPLVEPDDRPERRAEAFLVGLAGRAGAGNTASRRSRPVTTVPRGCPGFRGLEAGAGRAGRLAAAHWKDCSASCSVR
jgi:hypothetical protein